MWEQQGASEAEQAYSRSPGWGGFPRVAPFLLPPAPAPRLLCPFSPSGGAWRKRLARWVFCSACQHPPAPFSPQALLPAHPPPLGEMGMAPSALILSEKGQGDLADCQPGKRGEMRAPAPSSVYPLL